MLLSLTQCNINVQKISASTVRSERSGNTVVDDLCVVTKITSLVEKKVSFEKYVFILPSEMDLSNFLW